MKTATFWATLIGIGFLLGVISGSITSAIASTPMPKPHNLLAPSFGGSCNF